MPFKFWRMVVAALGVASTIAVPGFASAAHAMGCECCKGKGSLNSSKAGGGCMGGGEKAGGKGGMSCMKGMAMGNVSSAQKASPDAMMSGMEHSKMDMPGMDMSGEAVAEGNADVAFAKAMIPHHEAALEMAKQLLKNGKNDEMKAMANEIIAAQSKEIKTLYGWLAKNAE